MVIVKDIVNLIEEHFPLSVQEDYDNSGLILGDAETEISGILLTIDITEKVIEEAISKGLNLIISHHPIIFRGLKKLTGQTNVEKSVIKAIRNNICIYSGHTSVDNSFIGLNKYLADLLELTDLEILSPQSGVLYKLVTYVPVEYSSDVREALFSAGAGHIGNYDKCSYNIYGEGTFRALSGSSPFVGKISEYHKEKEERIETIFSHHKKNKILSALFSTHPYEEVAYDIYKLENNSNMYGSGVIGNLKEEESESNFLKKIKERLNISTLRHSELLDSPVRRVSICSGAGHFLTEKSIASQADVFISSEFKYNQFTDVQGKILIVDAGHYETEIFIKNIFYDLIIKKFSTFAVKFSDTYQNPVKYL